MALGAVMAVVGAILRFAVSVSTSGFSIHTVGDILLIAGIVIFLASILVLVLGSGRRTRIREDVQQTPSGQTRIEERDDRGDL